MPLLLDTYNILHTTGVLPPEVAGPETDGLARLIAGSRYGRETVQMVCDGTGRPYRPVDGADIRVRFAGPGAEADTLIREMVDAAADPRRVTVVSSDAEVQRAARRRRCKVLSSEAFLEHLARDGRPEDRPRPRPAKPPAPLSDDQVDRWIDIFDLDGSELDLPAASTHGSVDGSSASSASSSPATGHSDEPAEAGADETSCDESSAGPDETNGGKTHRAAGPVFPGDVLRQAERLIDDPPDDDRRDDDGGRKE